MKVPMEVIYKTGLRPILSAKYPSQGAEKSWVSRKSDKDKEYHKTGLALWLTKSGKIGKTIAAMVESMTTIRYTKNRLRDKICDL